MTTVIVPESKRALRRDRAAWQRAAVGMLALAVMGNVLLYGHIRRQERDAEALRERYAAALYTRDAALRAAGELQKRLDAQAAEVEAEATARAAQAAAYADYAGWKYLGQCELTAYCCERYDHICGTGDGLTATGLEVRPGIVAVDPEVIPLGSTVIIDGVRYLAADTGGGIRGSHIDIAVERHADALAFGVQYADVWVVPPESEAAP